MQVSGFVGKLPVGLDTLAWGGYHQCAAQYLCGVTTMAGSDKPLGGLSSRGHGTGWMGLVSFFFLQVFFIHLGCWWFIYEMRCLKKQMEKTTIGSLKCQCSWSFKLRDPKSRRCKLIWSPLIVPWWQQLQPGAGVEVWDFLMTWKDVRYEILLLCVFFLAEFECLSSALILKQTQFCTSALAVFWWMKWWICSVL